jgi:hypothetical protein
MPICYQILLVNSSDGTFERFTIPRDLGRGQEDPVTLSNTAISGRRDRRIVDEFPSELVIGRYRIPNLH